MRDTMRKLLRRVYSLKRHVSILAGFLLALNTSAFAQSKAVPRTKDGKPSFVGVWLSDPKTYANVGTVALKPAYQKIYQQRSDDNPAKKDPVARCLPTGVPRILADPFQIMQTPKVVLMMFQGGTHSFRQLFLDEPHPDDIDAAWMGHSVAKWEGDTLVVDTNSFNDLTWLNAKGLPHSESLHVVERYTRPDVGHLNVTITMDDKEAFAKPVTFQRVHTLAAGKDSLSEFVCNEKSIDQQGLIGIK
jgi:hypothetical protein